MNIHLILFLLALELSLSSISASTECTEEDLNKRQECLKLFFGSNRCNDRGLVQPELAILNGLNQTLENEDVYITVNLTNYTHSWEPYTEIVCLSKPIPELLNLPKFYSLDCKKNVIKNFTKIPIKWKTAGNGITVYVFVKRNESTDDEDLAYVGCDKKDVNIASDKHLNITVTAFQDNSTNDRLFQMGNVSIFINTSEAIDNSLIKGEESSEGSGMALPPVIINEYRYTIFFDNNQTKPQHRKINQSEFELIHNFTKEGNNTVFVEVLHNRTVNGTLESLLYYGESEVKFEVYEPIKNTSMKFTNQSKANVSVEVRASGSLPISVSWVVTRKSKSNSTSLCNKNQTVLNHTINIGTFNCTISEPDTYYFSANFSNKVSNKTEQFTYKIKKPSNKKTVVTTSTTVVVIVLLIVVVVIAIVLISGYISYQKLRNRSTETANFTFVNLDNPSRLQRVKNQLSSVKERVSRNRNQSKLGLVQPKDGEMSDVESFYGSLTNFPDHDNL